MKKMNKKGFTLIELLAVIVILGLLMAIAIPSVTKYITQSRKKTLASTIGNYISALTTEVNNMDYTFTDPNKIYAVPIECIALERGGTDPFGAWYPANASNNYWAYVLVQYNDSSSSYTYGFTFKDSAGYGLMPTASTKIKEKGSQIATGLALTAKPFNLKPTVTGDTTTFNEAIDFVPLKDTDGNSNWSGFNVGTDTLFAVLASGGEYNETTNPYQCAVAQQ